MVLNAQQEPQSALDYDDRTTGAVKAVLIEIGQILGSYQGKFAVIGGLVPWLLLDNEEMPHVGTIDIDLSLDHTALGDGEYATLVESLLDNGYRQSTELRRFQLVRTVPATDGGADIEVVIDFLMARDAKVVKNNPPLIEDFAVQKADGADLALKFPNQVPIEGLMPNGSKNRVEVAVASIPALLAMKGYAINNRLKKKDAYDIYYCIRNYPGGIEAIVDACKPLLDSESAERAYRYINSKFETEESFGPVSVREFVQESQILGELTPEQWQRDAFGQVEAWLMGLGLRFTDLESTVSLETQG